MSPERKAKMDAFRHALAGLVAEAYLFATSLSDTDSNKGEQAANTMLAIRHMEDAAMRFGKVVQAGSGGTSPLGGPATLGTALPPSGNTNG